MFQTWWKVVQVVFCCRSFYKNRALIARLVRKKKVAFILQQNLSLQSSNFTSYLFLSISWEKCYQAVESEKEKRRPRNSKSCMKSQSTTNISLCDCLHRCHRISKIFGSRILALFRENKRYLWRVSFTCTNVKTAKNIIHNRFLTKNFLTQMWIFRRCYVTQTSRQTSFISVYRAIVMCTACFE